MLLTEILPVVLYGCETWSLTPREKHRMRAFENRVLKRIFWPNEQVMKHSVLWSNKVRKEGKK
jgi:hypothetical protein